MKLTKEEAINKASHWFSEGENVIYTYEASDFGFISIITAYKAVIREYVVYESGSISLHYLKDDNPCFLNTSEGDEDE